jgi:N-6 DNA Methylase
MAIILPHGVVFRGGAEAKIRRKLLDDGHIDNVIGLGARQHIDSRCEIAASLGRGGIVRPLKLRASPLGLKRNNQGMADRRSISASDGRSGRI